MKIRNKLILSTGISILLIVFLGSLIFVTSGRVTEGTNSLRLITDIRNSVSELNFVTYDYLLHREERMIYQWFLISSSLEDTLNIVLEEEELASIQTRYRSITNLFSQVTSKYHDRQQLIQGGASQDKVDTVIRLEDRLISQLLIELQSIFTDASSFAGRAQDEIEAAQRLATNATITLSVVLAITVGISSLLVFRSITKPLDKLIKGTEIIGKGNLEHKVDIQSKDELGQLAVAFNEMRGNLLEDRTEREYAEHDLSERVKELTCLYGVSQYATQTNTNLDEIFKGMVSLLPPGWQYPEVTCAKITFGDKEFETENFKITQWKQSADINIQGDKAGSIQIYYLKEKPEAAEGPFLEEERSLLNGLTLTVSSLIERKRAEEELQKAHDDLEIRVEERTKELAQANTELVAVNDELEAFSYSVSHDLRAPLRSIDGFSQALLEDYPDELDEQGKHYLNRVRAASQRMGQLIDDLLKLSRLTRGDMKYELVDLTILAKTVAENLKESQEERQVEFIINEGLVANGDARLIRALLENLLSNAWKFTSTHPRARIELDSTQIGDQEVFFVSDDGAGFDMAYADKLFGAFQRLHSPSEFPGTGIGLATVKRIVHRHGGNIWAEGALDKGATFYFSFNTKGEQNG